MAEQSTLQWMCTCLCENYLELVNKVLFIMGVLVLIFAAWMVFMDPLSDRSLESMRELASVSKTKWAAFIAGPLIMIASCLGLNFAKTGNRGVGIGYLVCILVALILQFAVVSVATGGVLSDINKISEVSDKFQVGEEKSKQYNELVADGKDSLISKTFRSWAKRWNNPASKNENYDCSLDTGSFWADHGDDSPTPAVAPTATASSSWIRRLGDDGDDDKTPNWKCVPEKMEVTCDKMSSFGEKTSAYCMAKAGHEKEFTGTCTQCVEKWWDLWNMKEHDNGDVPDLEHKFNHDSGIAYCRCMSRFFDSVQRHYPTIRTMGLVFGILQLIVVASTAWLLLFGPKHEVNEPEIEMNLGQQGASGSGHQEMQTVICPDNAGPGMPVMVTLADGRAMQAIVPPGVAPGMPFQIAV